MKYIRIRELNGLSGPMYCIEYTKTDGERWIATSVHNKLEVAEREMCSYIESHREECAFWEGSAAQKIFDVTGAELHPGDPERCQGNGKHEGYECCCDECDFLECCLESEEIDLRGSHERRSAPQDRGGVRQTKLEEFLK